MSETVHPWCRDVSRDKAIRAAEDAAAAERTPMPDHRDLPAAVAELRKRVAALEAVIPKSVSVSNAEAHENKAGTMHADGLRTEWVTLEVTHDSDDGHIKYRNWDDMLFNEDRNGIRFPGESVRVVHEAENNAAWMDRLTAERNAERAEAEKAKAECERLRDVVRQLSVKQFVRQHEAAATPAANAGGVSNPEPISGAGKSNRQGNLDGSQEPVAWGVMVDGKIDRTSFAAALFFDQVAAEKWCGTDSLRGTGTVVPLYAAPQPPRGWLTEEEREAVENARSYYHAQTCGMNEDGGWYKLHKRRQLACEALLARSTPPKVKMPPAAQGETPLVRDLMSGQAIREAGGEVCE